MRKFNRACRQFTGFESSSGCGEKFARFVEKKCCAATDSYSVGINQLGNSTCINVMSIS